MGDHSQSSSADWRRLYPFESHWAELAGGRMHFLDEGPKKDWDTFSANRVDSVAGSVQNAVRPPVLLFVHGNPTWSFHWRRMIKSLRPHFRCVAPDHLGCGLSDKPARLMRLETHIAHLAALVEHLRLERITLVAQDWGGAIGLGTMLQMRDRFEQVVLFNTGAFPPPYIPWRIRACRLPVFGRLAVQGANLFSRAALRMTLARRARLDRAVAAGYLAPYDSWSNRRAVYGFVRDIPAHPPHPTWSLLQKIERQLPTLARRPICLIWGMRDWCFRPDCLERFLEAWPDADVHRLADVGHWVVEDAPEESLQIMERFLEHSLSVEKRSAKGRSAEHAP